MLLLLFIPSAIPLIMAIVITIRDRNSGDAKPLRPYMTRTRKQNVLSRSKSGYEGVDSGATSRDAG